MIGMIFKSKFCKTFKILNNSMVYDKVSNSIYSIILDMVSSKQIFLTNESKFYKKYVR